jgi:hypothetical protein
MRISERISTAVTGGVQCPGCGKIVKPVLPAAEPEATDAEGGKRWSFVWRDPCARSVSFRSPATPGG